jgi:hypothetical protein
MSSNSNCNNKNTIEIKIILIVILDLYYVIILLNQLMHLKLEVVFM